MRRGGLFLALSLLLAASAHAGDDPGPAGAPVTTAQAADAAAAAFRGHDEAALSRLAARDAPDPWLVADELLGRGEADAALAFARAAPGPDTAKLPAYVASRRDGADEAPLRSAYRAAAEALARGDAQAALDATQAAGPLPDTVLGARLCLGKALALRALARPEEGLTSLEEAGAAATRIGWLRCAASCARDAGSWARARGDLEAARTAWEQGLALDEARGYREGVAWTLGTLGNLALDRGESAEARSLLERSLALQEALESRSGTAWVLGSLGVAHAAVADYPTALSFYERSLALREALGDRVGVATLLGNIGSAHRQLGDYAKALACQERALAMKEELGDRVGTAATLANLGSLHRSRGDYGRALSYYERALAQMESTGNRPGVAQVLSSLGTVHAALGDYPQAFTLYERALALSRDVGARRTEAYALSHVATLHARLGEYDAALEAHRRVLALMEATGDRAGVATVLANLGGVLDGRGDEREALATYERALGIAEAISNPGLVADVLGNVGQMHRRLGEPALSLAALERSLALCEAQGDRAHAAWVRGEVGRTLHAMGRTEEGTAMLERAVREERRLRARESLVAHATALARLRLEDGDPGQALTTAQQTLPEVEAVLGGLAEEEGAAARATVSDLFGVGALAAYRLDRPGDALAFLESGRAGSLLESLGAGRAVRFADLPADLLAAEEAAKAKEARAHYEYRRALDGGGKEAIRRAARAVDEAVEGRRQVAVRIQREAKRVAGVFYPRAATVEEVQGWLADDEALVLYAACLDEMLALVLTNASVRIVELGPVREAEALCRNVGGSLAREGGRGPLGAPPVPEGTAGTAAELEALRRRLVEPLGLGADVRTVFVSPDGALGYAPWGALLDVPVACVPSGTTYALLREEERAPGAQVLALGDPDYGSGPDAGAVAIYTRGGRLGRLPATRAEAEAIGNVVRLGAEANEQKLKEVLRTQRHWRAVHFACHGLVDPEHPTLSSLALTPTGTEDGFVTCLDVFRMEIPADLVALSACETARGRVVAAEGIVGLTRAFMYAGAPRVLCSLWKVDDEATRALMEKFYDLWNPKDGAPGLGAAEALRQAQAWVRSQEAWRDPYYWAAWVLWGLAD